MNLNKWFEKGMTHIEYIQSMDMNQENLLRIYNEFAPSREAIHFLQSLQNKNWRAVILTADWCGDAMLNIPIFMRLANEGLIDTRFLIRDDNLELMDQFLTNGGRSIPLMIILDRDGNFITRWGPRSPLGQDIVMSMKKNMPNPEDEQFETARKEFIKKATHELLTNEKLWDSVEKSLVAAFQEHA
ncbi:thioredoxin family protein [Bacillus sp. HMF5848]|uniref:thioredoxin family protein n=1 Tax=Bacillus sp. HMF5848 TaxID=2495421 RepID=UPI000F7B9AB5|nr:thioredoxin family protein [Bacillus sp. HMF5848]RSK29157.1 thioredoxin family protein [Bacillus sp. HMF5848]